MRSLLVLAALVACSAPDAQRSARPERGATAAPAAISPPGLRLPADDVTPLHYELKLELDPEAAEFHGEVAIRARIERPIDHFWIHADELEIARATIDGAPLADTGVAGDQMRGFSFGRTRPRGEVTLRFEFTGHALHDEQGVFRQRDRDHWYLFTQSESVFARRITPCFDEPRFKTPWQVTLVVPAGAVALGNMPQAGEQALPDGRREVRFVETPPLPSYLLAFAVGPFELVSVGPVGQGRVPVRVAALHGDRDKVGVVALRLPAVVDAIETYTGDALPWPKLDLVVVPRLFGAMENSGLVTFDQASIVGDPAQLASHFTRIAAHEVAHHWFGNLVTPAWWDDLWLAESTASWLGDKVTAQLGELRDPALDAALARERARQADDATDARPLRPAIARNADPEAEFGAIAYDKGQTVLAMFERWLGDDRFRAAVRSYVAHHRGGTATTRDLITELGGGELGEAFASYTEHAGTPVVDLAIRCDGAPAAIARARDGRRVPICVRDPAGRRVCAVAGPHTELALSSCPAWLVGNDGGLAYYDVVAAPPPPAALTAMSALEKIALGDDAAGALLRGDISLAAALAELTALARSHDPYAQHGAVAIAQAIDPLVDDAARPAWGAWLAKRFADRLVPSLIAPGRPVELQLRDDLALLIPADQIPASVARAARRAIAGALVPEPELVALARDAATCDRLAKAARAAKEADVRDALVEDLGACGADRIDHALDVVLAASAPTDQSWAGIEGYLARPATRGAAWRAVRAQLPALFARATPSQASALIGSLGLLCDASSRSEAAAALEPHVADLPDGRAVVDHALAALDRCIARRARLGDLAAALGL